RHTRSKRDWSSDVCSSDLVAWQELQRAFWDGPAARAWIGVEPYLIRQLPSLRLGSVENAPPLPALLSAGDRAGARRPAAPVPVEIGRASCRESGGALVGAV